MLEMFSLKGKVALVTGASRGLGKPVAKGMAAAGAHVVAVARDEEKLQQTKQEIEEAGGKATVLALDLSDEDAVRAGVRNVAAELGRIDICANIAGIINWQPLLDSDEEDFQRTMDTNVRGTFVMSQECAAVMRAGGRGGRIITTASVLGPLGRAKLHAYCASKSAIIGLTRSLASELGREEITVNCVAPGYFLTEINANLQSRPGYMDAINGVTPMERWGKPEEIVGAMIFLASDAATFVNGQVLHVDGGVSSSFKFQLAA
ncbi:SDR family NAD(P)-dependent oxidoreductase [Oricola indica]|uniref:SDR family NAD(P)-dependent oxidoreductase n=1 Tax=Oricola indica TaxID=2872591 RepID=UPI001CC197F7|nr:glucose 1-dehydrogenase [Oricola indica]